MIITSLVDNDLYKFTMQQALLKLGFGAVPVKYKFHCRKEGIDFSNHVDSIKDEINSLSELQFKKDEINFLRSLRYMSDEYISFIKYFRFDPRECVKVSLNDETGELDIKVKGPWFHTILFEVPILSIVSEVYSTIESTSINDVDDSLKIIAKVKDLRKSFKFADFGTRRRKSKKWHEKIIDYCKDVPNFIGTSNVQFAMQYNLIPIGTMAHEWFQAHQQLGYRLADSQKMALENWMKVYRGDLGIALSDTINTDAFLKDFDDPIFYKLFDGVREDSEPDPIAFGYKIVNFYTKRNINPLDKTIIFSNGLTFKTAQEIHNGLMGLINTSFGIGTHLTNNCEIPALNIVLKMVSCNNQPVAKTSNSPGKGMCESPEFVSYLKSVYNLEQN